jgi:DNA-binding transcriptional LysR family regulator
MVDDPSQLRLLALVEAHGSLSGAAAELALTPAAVTAQVARAEAAWGLPLVHRGPRGASLTEAGRVLARHGEAIDDACVAARRELDAAVGVTSGRLRIGTFSSAAIRLLPEAMTALRHRHPEGDLSVEEITSIRGEEMLTSGRLDLAVVATYDEDPTWPDPLLVCLPAEHRLAQGDPSRRVRLAQLRGEPWVAIMRGESARAQFDRAAAAVELEPRVMFETEAYDVAQALVGTGLGAAALTRLAARPVPGDVHRELERPRLHRRLWALHLADTRLTPLVDDFVGLLVDVAADLEAHWRTTPVWHTGRA